MRKILSKLWVLYIFCREYIGVITFRIIHNLKQYVWTIWKFYVFSQIIILWRLMLQSQYSFFRCLLVIICITKWQCILASALASSSASICAWKLSRFSSGGRLRGGARASIAGFAVITSGNVSSAVFTAICNEGWGCRLLWTRVWARE